MFKSKIISVLIVCSVFCLNAQEREGRLLGMDKETRVKDLYFIIFKDNTEKLQDAFIESISKTYSGKILSRYQYAMQGVSVELPDEFAREVSALPIVAFVEAIGTVKPASTSGIPWGTDRIDQRDLPLNEIYTSSARGSGVHAYIIDTGIRATHNAFIGRMGAGANFSGSTNGDCFNHGTYVAGILGGSSIGTADDVMLHDVKVFDCAGNTTENIIADGINWVAANFQQPAVANMSLESSFPGLTIDIATQGLIDAGVTVVAAAGNGNGGDACSVSPARVGDTITVANSDKNDNRYSTSNIGSCVDLFAPGAYTLTSTNVSDNSYASDKSGTSMAAPHVAGIVAHYLQNNHNATPAEVKTAILNNASLNKISNPGTGTPNRLLYSEFSNTSGPSAPTNFNITSAFCFGLNDATWTHSTGNFVANYELWASTSSNFNSTWKHGDVDGTESYEELNVSNSTWFRIRACNAFSCSSFSNKDRAVYSNNCF